MAKNEAAVYDGNARKEFSFDMKVVNVNLDQLMVAYHPRINLGSLQSLQESIRRDGLQDPLLVYPLEDGRYAIIDGYRRLEAVREFGWQSVPCIIKNVGATEAAHLSYLKNTERQGFDPIEAALHFKAMRDRFGFTLGELELKGYGSRAFISKRLKLLDLPNPIKEKIQEGVLTAAHGEALTRLPTDKARLTMMRRIVDHDLSARRVSNQIDAYLTKSKKEPVQKLTVPSTEIDGVYIKDSRDMSELPDNSVHLIVSSPPYWVGMPYEKGVTFEEHKDMIEGVLKECARVLVSGGIIALNVGDILNFKGPKGKSDITYVQMMGHKYQAILRRYGIFLTDQIIWQKSKNWKSRQDLSLTEKTIHTTYRMLANYEPVYIFRKKGERDLPSEDIVLESMLTKEQWTTWLPAVWQIEPVRDTYDHPCPYPEELVERLVRMFSYVGDRVLDPWLGSGTTVKVARALGREAVGYEKEPQYKDVIMRKLGVESLPADDALGLMAESIRSMQNEAPPAPTLEEPEGEEDFDDDQTVLHFEVGEAA